MFRTPIMRLKPPCYANYNQICCLISIWPHLYANEVSIQIDQGIIQLCNMFYCIWHVLHAFFIHINHNPTFMISRYMVWLHFELHLFCRKSQPSCIMQIRFSLQYQNLIQCILHIQKPLYRHLNHHVTWIITRVIWCDIDLTSLICKWGHHANWSRYTYNFTICSISFDMYTPNFHT